MGGSHHWKGGEATVLGGGESGFLENKEGIDKPSSLKILTSLLVAAYQ